MGWLMDWLLKYFWYSFFCGMLFLCATTQASELTPVWLNVYIHGTVRPYLSAGDFFKVMRNSVRRSAAANIVRCVRTDPFFYHGQPIQALGLKKAFPRKNSSEFGAHIFAKLYDDVTRLVHADNLPMKHYTFGWSGLMTRRSRKIAASRLFQELSHKITRLRARGFEPHVRILGYSHGGTVALLLSQCVRHERVLSWHVDELLLLATPIQSSHQNYVLSPLFKKIYNFYSIGDFIQPFDFMSSRMHSFSHRTFMRRGRFAVPAHVTQVQIQFLRKKFEIRRSDGSTRVVHRIDYINPGHIEMFLFGWAYWYRRHFPINPLPVAVLLPIFTHAIEQRRLMGAALQIVVIPDDEILLLRDKKTKQCLKLRNLMPYVKN